MYNLVANPINRYSLGDRGSMKTAANGSLAIYLQHEQPDEDKSGSWLPAPKGDFFLFLRTYTPGQSMLDQTRQPSAVALLK
jgi:hypothetical protein